MCGNSKKNIEKLKTVITQIPSCSRKLKLSTKIPKIHDIEDHFLNQFKKYNGIGCFTEDFIEQTHQFRMNDDKRTVNMRDKVKESTNHSRMESLSLNSEVK